MTGAVLDEGDEASARPCRQSGGQFVQQVADRVHDIQIGPLIIAADIIGLAGPTLGRDEGQGAGVIIDIEPVADVQAIAIDRQRLALHRVQDGQGHELFGEVIGAVIVRAVGDHHRQAIGMEPGLGQMIGCGLRSRIGRARIIGRRLVEKARVAQTAIDLIGRDMQIAEAILLCPLKPAPIDQRRLQHDKGAHHIGEDEGIGPIDRPVDMAFGGQMHDHIWLKLSKGRRHGRGVGNIGLQEAIKV